MDHDPAVLPPALKYTNGRLTPHGVAELHRLRAEGKTYQAIATVLGVCPATVYGTAKGKTNKDLHPGAALTLTRETLAVQTGVRAGVGPVGTNTATSVHVSAGET